MKLKIIAIILAALMLASCGAKPEENSDEPSTTKSTAAEELISPEQAAQIALDDAIATAPATVSEKLSALTASDAETEMSALNGIPKYDVEIDCGYLELKYEIDSQNGAIRSYKRLFDFNAAAEAEGGNVTLEEAGDYAVWYLDLDKNSVSEVSGELDEDFLAYILTIKTADGDIRCWADEYTGVMQRSTKDIGPYRAEELCYEHLLENISEDAIDGVTNLLLAGDIDQSTEAEGISSERQYKIELCVGGYDYEYTVDGLSGLILTASCNPDDDYEGEPVGGFENNAEIVQPTLPDMLSEDFVIEGEGE